jgi:UDP-N-acetylglucosamine 3-dehydrogenase
LSGTKLRVGVIGAGYWGKKLIGEYLSLSRKRDDIQLTRIVDCDKERLANVAKEFNLPTDMFETDAPKVLNNDSIDAAHIAIPNETHFPICMAALAAGKHVLVEKPMALTMREAIKLARRAEEKCLVLNVSHIFRFNNAVTRASSLLADGIVGKILTLHLNWEDLVKPPPKDRDIVFDLCPHPVDILNCMLGEWPTRVRAVGRSFLRRETGKEEVVHSLLEFNSDVFATIDASWIYAGPKRRFIEVEGERGCLQVDALNQRITTYSQERSKEYHVETNNTIETMITHFLQHIREKETQENSALVGIMTVGVLAAMRQSKFGRAHV